MGDTWRSHKTGLNSWSGSLECWFDDTDTAQGNLTLGASVTLDLQPEGTDLGDFLLTGTATITEKMMNKVMEGEWLPICQGTKGANFVVTSSVNAIFAPPTGSAYGASKAAIAKAFEGLALTYHGSNLSFSVVYPGPVKTEGLKGNLPFTWEPRQMAAYMVENSLKGKMRMENSLFYALLTRGLSLLPNKWVMKILGLCKKQ